MQAREKRGDGEVYVCVVEGDVGVVVPAWMFDRHHCEHLEFGERRASIAAFRNVRALVDAWWATRSPSGPGTVASEVSDVPTFAPAASESATTTADDVREPALARSRCVIPTT